MEPIAGIRQSLSTPLRVWWVALARATAAACGCSRGGGLGARVGAHLQQRLGVAQEVVLGAVVQARPATVVRDVR